MKQGLISDHELLAIQWDEHLNGSIDGASLGSSKKVSWICELGHQWFAPPADRVRRGLVGCPVCSGRQVLSGYNDLLSQSPQVASEWHSSLNKGLKPDEVTIRSSRKVWWRGAQCSHEWDATINSRTVLGQGCPICSGKRILVGFNDLTSQFPKVAEQWHPTKNGNLLPTEITPRSGRKMWWRCLNGHEYQSRVSDQTSPTRIELCPVCSGRKIISGENDLATQHPQLAREWHPTKNLPLTPETVSPGTHQEIWWVGLCGHEWRISASARTHGYGCPVCSGKVVVFGENDLYSKNPFLALLWHPTKNDLTPKQVTPRSSQKFWWQCPKGHSWLAAPKDVARTVQGRTGCAICAGKQVISGDNDLATLFPEVANQWHPTKNGALFPTQVPKSYGSPVWWKCEKGHEWESTPASRTNANGGWTDCGACSPTVSKQEKALLQSLREGYGGTIIEGTRRIIPPYEIDIYFPDQKVGVEFNGLYWHSEDQGKDQKYHYTKWLRAQETGVQLLQVWEDDWLKNPALVTKMILHKLNVSTEARIFARKTVACVITRDEAHGFLESNHIQGHVSGSVYLGLREVATQTLVAVLTGKWENSSSTGELTILRYATNSIVTGGFTKLLRYAELNYQLKRFITFSDNCVSDGGLYMNNGFVPDKELPPDYMYVLKGERKHKFGYRLKRFRNDPDLLWEDDLTERELAKLNGLPRVWDAGKTRWVKEVS